MALTLRPFTVTTMILILVGDIGLFMSIIDMTTRTPDLQVTDLLLVADLRGWGVPLAADLRSRICCHDLLSCRLEELDSEEF
ncbi:MAG: hypothetical protein OET55_00135 [Desulfuromonadales bacterium]|nr:hypothetical protein [Desulfuromonadales bacterium]MDH3807018.1 hypothetical protein [Desulfuromonadales bacterium]MDH3867763.1 hypothetical protein [Desulfuromonadales bacterium]MDH3959662.1 hypothetical protein [Desulfuromonadales bacterium]MDH4023917.1 hypothetical protein [Desulfuromonadales bacterium]